MRTRAQNSPTQLVVIIKGVEGVDCLLGVYNYEAPCINLLLLTGGLIRCGYLSDLVDLIFYFKDIFTIHVYIIVAHFTLQKLFTCELGDELW
jgi:hypothetical protein